MSRSDQCRPAPCKVLMAFPGGFEFGGIGRMMLYATTAFAGRAGAPDCVALDARGRGHVAWMPWHVLKTIGRIAFSGADLLHLNVAGRGSTLRKIVLSEVAARFGLPTIVHLHDYDYEKDVARRGPLVSWLVRRMFRRARRVVVLGLRDQACVTKLLGVVPDRVVRLANAVPDPGEPPARVSACGPVRLLFLGHLDDRKGVPELLTALASEQLRHVDWQLDLAGAGEVDRFKAMAERLGLRDRTSFHGWLDHAETYALSRRADIFVLPSHAEGQAMSLIEAMAHGLAIVATPVGAHLEAVVPDKEALLVAPGDAGALADALAMLIDDPAQRRALGSAARRRYLAGFTVEGYATRLSTIYQAALQRPERASAARQARVISPLNG